MADSEQEQSVLEKKFFLGFFLKNGRVQIGKSFIEGKIFMKSSRFRTEPSVLEKKFFSVFLWKNGRVQIEKSFIEEKVFLEEWPIRNKS